ncbi:MAG: DEAD/DEAH box helicase [Gammaproteobacteria bacterium]|nr:DEAD/DEAH box helicase [Gammaproteobacteria bacterium]
MFPRFSLRHVREVFLPRDFERGRHYFEEGRVRAFEVTERDDGSLSVRAEVRGSTVYVQEIDLEWRGGTLDVFSACSCPIGYDCKHVVAVCLMVRRYLASHPDADDAADSAAADQRLRRWLARIDAAGRDPEAAGDGEQSGERLIYVLNPRDDATGLTVELRVARPRKADGRTGKGRLVRLDRLTQGAGRPPSVVAEDEQVLRLLVALCPEVWDFRPRFHGRVGYLTLEQMLATGRCALGRADGPLLDWGESRPMEVHWFETAEGRLRLDISAGDAIVLATDPPVYLDVEQARLGPVDPGPISAAQLDELQTAPTLVAGDARALARLLTNEFPGLSLPLPAGAEAASAEAHPLVPHLLLTREPTGDTARHVLHLGFEYGGHRVPALPAAPRSLIETPDGALRVQRDPEAEGEALARLTALGFAVASEADRLANRPADVIRLHGGDDSVVDAASRWSGFLHEQVAGLRRDGWQVAFDESFRMQFESAAWQGEVTALEDGGNDWFSLRFDLVVGDRHVPLLPLLVPLLERGFDGPLPARISLPLSPTADGGSEDDCYVDLPTDRLLPFLETLRDLYGAAPEQAAGEADLTLSRFDAAALARLQAGGTPLRAPASLTSLAQRLADFSGIEHVPPPPGLRATLRQYQQHGLDWLQFLRSYELGGVLADDMGLGKTLQTLAHLLVEKDAGRLDRPALIVAPTSLMSNWRREAARFTPGLSVLVLHGPGRHADFARIGEYDVVLTTYPLLPRDQEALCRHAYHALILDEAQTVKNPRSQAAQVVRTLQARHRLCLTGTPMENHLGELWAQFDFLLPGFLSDADTFRRCWRKPIEEDGDEAVRAALARRLAPFMLRRRKLDVLDDLPPKTEILRTVTLHEDQAALYESVRLTMEDKVRRVIEAQGLARSHISILDALLKLRQVCCDPRLLSLEAARGVQSSAKLELLMEMLPELLEEGRRVLVFSQFTSMLELIEPELEGRGIDYSKLTGRTRDRDGAVQRFRDGSVDLLLVSLKAGGVGLNLTEADTVILYDPWWNPAVETQAADRAHRIGQTRAVFVYKLVTEGTVEEKILALQARKQALADGIYAAESGGNADAPFDPGELRELLSGGFVTSM